MPMKTTTFNKKQQYLIITCRWIVEVKKCLEESQRGAVRLFEDASRGRQRGRCRGGWWCLRSVTSVDNGMMFCEEEVLSRLGMTWGLLWLVHISRGRRKARASSFSILGARNSWPRCEKFWGEKSRFSNQGLPPAEISRFPPGSDQLSRNSCRGEKTGCRWKARCRCRCR